MCVYPLKYLTTDEIVNNHTITGRLMCHTICNVKQIFDYQREELAMLQAAGLYYYLLNELCRIIVIVKHVVSESTWVESK